MIQKADGDYDGALASLRTVESMYPRDRVVLNQIARILFLKRQYAEAVKVLERVCQVDPEDLQMHYTMMLCYRGLGDREKAAREEKSVPALQSRGIGAIHHGDPPAAEPGRQQRAAADPRPRKRAHLTARWSVTAQSRPRRDSADRGECGAMSTCNSRSFCVAVAATLPPTTVTTFTSPTSPTQAGIKFTHNSRRAGKKYLPETLGSGVRLLRRRRRRLARHPAASTARTGRRGAANRSRALYRNNHNGTFTDITAGSGLDVEMYGMGVAIGDYDNDGRDDVYITALDGDHLFHNEGDGKFRDVTAASGIRNANFGTSAAWLDYDRDGKLDLFVANYVQWTPEGRSVVLARRRDQVLLHAGIVQGHFVQAVSQPGRRQV